MEVGVHYELVEHGTAVEVRVSGAAGHEPELLKSLRDCQSGRCGCPTRQYDRLAAMDVETGDGAVTIRLQPRSGQRLDPNELRACLDNTLTKMDRQ